MRKKRTNIGIGIFAFGILIGLVMGGRYARDYQPGEIVSPLSAESQSKPVIAAVPRASLRQEIEREIEAIFAPSGEEAVRMAKIVAGCESNYRGDAVNNDSKDFGLFQINQVHKYKEEDLLEYKKNIRVAYALFLRDGWQPWYPSKECQEYNILKHEQ